MLRRGFLRAVLATPLAGWLRPWMPAAFGGEAGPGPNAAAIYRRAFGWAEGLTAEEMGRLREAASSPSEHRGVEALIEQAGPALEALREAAAIDRCDWGVEVLSSDHLLKGHLHYANVRLVSVACLSARRHAAGGRGRQALDDVFAGLALAHRVGTGGVLVARVLEGNGESEAFQALGRMLPGLDRATLDDLARRLDALPPPEPASATIAGPEWRFVRGSLRAKLLADGPPLEGAAWGELGLTEEQAAPLARRTGGDRAALLAHLEANAPAFTELARRLDLPRPACLAALDEFAESERSAHPIAAVMVNPARGARNVVDRMRALRAMLRAGLALVRDGEAAFREVPDPFDSGPFGLERRGKGHLIRSGLKDSGRPDVMLAIGDAA